MKNIPQKAIDIIAKYNEQSNECFNIFNTIGLHDDDEVKLHTPFITHLLNANAEHGMKDAFLKEFIAVVYGESYTFDTEKSYACAERIIGPVTKDSGGRMDIIVESNCRAIIVENKLNAKDQPNQLLRYKNYADTFCKNGYEILYLSLDGHKANDIAESEYRCISYKEHILKWLEQCLCVIPAEKHAVREAILQYKALVEKLTHPSLEDSVLEELKNYVTRNELFNYYFFKNLCVRLEMIGCEIENGKLENNNDHLQQWFTFYIKPKNSDKPKISFQFQKENAKEFIYGIQKGNIGSEGIESLILFERWDCKKNGWICSNHFDLYRNWGAREYMMITNHNSKLYDYIVKVITELLFASGAIA